MLFFTKEEIEVARKSNTKCVVCKKRRASWRSVRRNSAEKGKVPMCGWCIMHSGESVWGYENRDEILYVGKAAQEQAVKIGKALPALDERGRLMPEDSEKFLLGVAFTSKMLSRVGKPLKILNGETINGS